MTNTQASVEIFPHKIVCCGNWTLASIQKLTAQVNTLVFPVTTVLQIDMRLIERLDTAGAWLFNRLIQLIHQNHIATTIISQDKKQENLLELVAQAGELNILEKIPRHHSLLERLGRDVVERFLYFTSFLGFIGELSILTVKGLFNVLRLPWLAISSVIEYAGCYALPLIALLNFLVGVVLAYQAGVQLRNYGADIYVVDLLGLSILREFGPLITAIILAGRTGSAFTAEIGTMIVNEEVDALQTMGINPKAYLALPKLLAMILIVPLLTVWADVFGILGGMVMAKAMLNVTYVHFFDRFREAIPLSSYVVGLIKTPIFAMIIATVGCYQGFLTVRRADSVGKQTTKSVVQAIFLIIIIDAAFSILFSWAKI